MYRRRLCRLLRPLGKPEIKIQFGTMRTTKAAGLRRPQSRDVAKVLLVRAGRDASGTKATATSTALNGGRFRVCLAAFWLGGGQSKTPAGSLRYGSAGGPIRMWLRICGSGVLVPIVVGLFRWISENRCNVALAFRRRAYHWRRLRWLV